MGRRAWTGYRARLASRWVEGGWDGVELEGCAADLTWLMARPEARSTVQCSADKPAAPIYTGASALFGLLPPCSGLPPHLPPSPPTSPQPTPPPCSWARTSPSWRFCQT